ncbi:hypothetical protein CWI37_1138p0010, partial [Hamiltosporidium tvaerminnensis]
MHKIINQIEENKISLEKAFSLVKNKPYFIDLYIYRNNITSSIFIPYFDQLSNHSKCLLIPLYLTTFPTSDMFLDKELEIMVIKKYLLRNNTSQVSHINNTLEKPHIINTLEKPHIINTLEESHINNTSQVSHIINTSQESHINNTPQESHINNTSQVYDIINTPRIINNLPSYNLSLNFLLNNFTYKSDVQDRFILTNLILIFKTFKIKPLYTNSSKSTNINTPLVPSNNNTCKYCNNTLTIEETILLSDTVNKHMSNINIPCYERGVIIMGLIIQSIDIKGLKEYKYFSKLLNDYWGVIYTDTCNHCKSNKNNNKECDLEGVSYKTDSIIDKGVVNDRDGDLEGVSYKTDSIIDKGVVNYMDGDLEGVSYKTDS